MFTPILLLSPFIIIHSDGCTPLSNVMVLLHTGMNMMNQQANHYLTNRKDNTMTKSQLRFMGILHTHSKSQIAFKRLYQAIRRYIRMYPEQPHMIIYYFNIDFDYITGKYDISLTNRINLFKWFYFYFSNTPLVDMPHPEN